MEITKEKPLRVRACGPSEGVEARIDANVVVFTIRKIKKKATQEVLKK